MFPRRDRSPSPSRRRRLVVALGVVVVLVVAALLIRPLVAPAHPEVTFAAGGANSTTGPARYCDVKLTDCADDPAAAARLAVPPGTALQVTVPDDVAQAPWHVVFRYRDGAGQEVGARSGVLARQEHDYTLTLPEPADRLLTAEVQQFGPAPRIDEQTGELEFPVRATWVLDPSG